MMMKRRGIVSHCSRPLHHPIRRLRVLLIGLNTLRAARTVEPVSDLTQHQVALPYLIVPGFHFPQQFPWALC